MKPKATLYYDGECPFCAKYSEFIELRKQIDITMKNAREHKSELNAYTECDINEGFIIINEIGDCYQGIDAIRWIDEYLKPEGTGAGLHHWLANLGRAGDIIYRIIRFTRKLLLRLLGRSPKI